MRSIATRLAALEQRRQGLQPHLEVWQADGDAYTNEVTGECVTRAKLDVRAESESNVIVVIEEVIAAGAQ